MSDLSTDMLTSSTFSRFLDEEGLETLANRIDQVFARKGEGGSKLEYAIYEDSPTLYPHDVNDLIKYNGIYYKVKVAMPETGVALVVGTNIELANLPAGTGVFLDKIPGSGGGGGGGDASVLTELNSNCLIKGNYTVSFNAPIIFINGTTGKSGILPIFAQAKLKGMSVSNATINSVEGYITGGLTSYSSLTSDNMELTVSGLTGKTAGTSDVVVINMSFTIL